MLESPEIRIRRKRGIRFRRGVAVIAGAALLLTLAGAAPAGAATVTIAAAGDIARVSPASPQIRTAGLVSGINPAKVLVLGDAQYEEGKLSEFQASYDRSWGPFNAKAAPVPGNHEYLTPSAAGYFQYFAGTLSQYGATARDPKKGYYSFNVGDWHVIGLNTNCSGVGVNCTTERSWLRSDLQSDGHRCELVFSHHSHRGFATEASANGVDLFLSGHKHTYERWDRRYGLPLRQLIVGTGGKSLGQPSTSADAGVRAYGVVKLTLTATGYSWQFIDIANDVRDSGSGTCRT